MVKTRRVRKGRKGRKGRKTRSQQGGFLRFGKIFLGKLTNEQVKGMLKDNTNIYEEPNRLIDEFVVKYSNILLDYLDRGVDYYNSDSSVGKLIPAIPHTVRDQFRKELTEDVNKNFKLTRTEYKFIQLVYFRYKYLNSNYGNTRTNNNEHTVESVAKAIQTYINALKIPETYDNIKGAMKNIRDAIKAATQGTSNKPGPNQT